MKLTALAVTLALVIVTFAVPAPYVIFLVPITVLWFFYEIKQERSRP
jgi:hypothetical protein